jgi:hypothetical protein
VFEAHISQLLADTHAILQCALDKDVVMYLLVSSTPSYASETTIY